MIPRKFIADLEPYVPGRRLAGGIKLSSNENPLGASPRALAVITEAASDISFYPDGGGYALREALAAQWNVEPEAIILGNGSDEIMVMIGGAFIEPGLNAITGANTFSQYTFATKIFGGEMRTTPMSGGRFDLDAMLGRIDANTRLVFICSPNNPTATIVTKSEFERFLARVPSHVLVVMDEAYAEFADDAEYPDTIELIATHPNLVRLRTFSKVYGLAGLRVGYGIGRPDVISAIAALRQPFNTGTVAQIAARAALADTDFVAETLANNREQRARLCDYLAKNGIAYIESQANFVCASFGSDERANRVEGELRRRQIAVRPLLSFGLPDSVRISIGTPSQMDALYGALDEILASVPVG